MKRGLKHGHDELDRLFKTVEESSPMKRGLKRASLGNSMPSLL